MAGQSRRRVAPRGRVPVAPAGPRWRHRADDDPSQRRRRDDGVGSDRPAHRRCSWWPNATDRWRPSPLRSRTCSTRSSTGRRRRAQTPPGCCCSCSWSAALALGEVWRLRRQAIAERDESRLEAAESLRGARRRWRNAPASPASSTTSSPTTSPRSRCRPRSARLTTPGISDRGAASGFGDIAETARDALGEMRRLLGVLREDAGGGGEREPQPGLAQLQELIDDARDASGTTVRFDRQRPGRPAVARRGPHRVPDRAGGADERPAPRTRRGRGRRPATTSRRSLRIRVQDDGPGPAAPPRTGTVCRGCASAPPWSVARCEPGRPTAAASSSRPSSPPASATPVRDVTIRVAVVDDQEVVRAGFAALLATQPDFEVAGVAGDGAEAVELCREQRPDVVLMDVRMPRMDGIEATRRIVEELDAANPRPRADDVRPRRVRLRRARCRRQRVPPQGRHGRGACSTPSASSRQATRSCSPRP